MIGGGNSLVDAIVFLDVQLTREAVDGDLEGRL
jgi:hypothetical protein